MAIVGNSLHGLEAECWTAIQKVPGSTPIEGLRYNFLEKLAFFCYFSKHYLDPKNVGLQITKKFRIILERQLPYLYKKQFEHVHKPGGWAHRLIKSMWRATSTLIKPNQQKAFIAHPHLFRFKSSQTSSRRKLFNLQSGTIFSAKFLTHKQTTVQKVRGQDSQRMKRNGPWSMR